MNQIAKFSKQIWRSKDVVTEPVTPSWKVPDLRQLPRETPAEVDAFSRNPIGKSLNDAVRTGRLDLPRSGKTPIVGDLLSNDSIRSQMASLSDTISQVPKGALQKASIESLSQMAPLNQLAHDRLAALPPETIGNVLKSGPPQQSTLFLQRMASEISGRPVSPGQPDIPQLEEIFHAVQTPQGDAKILGRTLINDEWYHFGTTSGTSPLQQASTWIAPTRLMASPNPAAQKDLNAGRVLKDVQGLFQGPWAPYVKGAGLLTKPHTVDIRHADQDGIKSVLATLDTITGTLKTIQSVTQGIQQGLEFIGMLGSLGSLGSYMQIFNQMKLPGTPGELITAMITGKGINPNKPPAPPTADQTGSGKNGVLVTKGGAAAKAMGDGLLAKAEAEKKKKEEAAKKKAEEEKKKAEAKQKAEEEAKQKAEEEAKQKAEEEAKQKTEEEAKQKAEEEAKQKAEEQNRTLCINSNVAEGDGNPGITDGHANISVHNPDGTVDTYGLWPDDHPSIINSGLNNGAGSDIRPNLANDHGANYDYSYCEEITDEQYVNLQQIIHEGDSWSLTNNCSSFASETFYDVTGTDVDADDVIGVETPREVGQHIQELNSGANSNRTSPAAPHQNDNRSNLP